MTPGAAVGRAGGHDESDEREAGSGSRPAAARAAGQAGESARAADRTPAASSAASAATAATPVASGGRVEQQPDEGRADDDAVGVGRDLGGLGAGRDAEPDADRQVGGAADPGDEGLGAAGDGCRARRSRPWSRRRRRSRG